MKKQFVIKNAQALKNIVESATKAESTNLLKFEFFGVLNQCCPWDVDPAVNSSSKPVFSL